MDGASNVGRIVGAPRRDAGKVARFRGGGRSSRYTYGVKIETVQRKFRVKVEPGDRAGHAEELVHALGQGEWLITVEPANPAVRDHSSFLAGYAREDDGLYDDLA